MKKIYKFLTAIAILGFAHGQMNAQCISPSAFGSGTANSTGTVNLTTCAFAGEYSTVTVTLATSYIFNSTGGAGNFITITNNANAVLTSGFAPLGVAIPSVGVYRAHVSTNTACGTENACRTISVAGAIFCTSPTQFASATINSVGNTTVTTCQFGGEFSVNTFTSTGVFTVTSTGGSGNYLTVKNVAGTTIYAQGLSPLVVNIPATGIYRTHLATSGPPTCGTDVVCHTVVYSGPAPAGCSGAPAAANVIATPTAICAGASSSLSLSTTYTASGIAYQWFSASALAGPYSAISGATLSAYPTGAITTNTFYRAVITCTNGPVSTTATAVQVIVNPTPTVVVSPSSSSICVPGASSVALTASGGTSYTWSPAASLSSSTGVSVNALPGSSTVYNVIGSNSVGCTSTGTASIVVSDKPSILSLSGTPTVICSGLSSTLQAMAATTSSYAVTSISYAPVSTPSIGVTTLCNNGATVVPLTSGSLDDGGWSNQTIPFSFNFFGSSYNSFAVSTNGFVYLGSGNPNTFTGYGNTFPSAFAARPSIGANYSDLDFDGVASNSKIEYFVSGSTPNQKLVVNWTGQFFNNTGTLTTQAIIHEATNIIEVHTFTSTGTNSSVEGIQNAAGTIAYVAPARNNVTFAISTPDAYRWTPVGSVASYSWSPSAFLSSTSASTTAANTMTASTIYSVDVTSANGCVTTGSIAITVNTTSISVNSGSVCVGNSFTLSPAGASTYTFSSGPIVTPTSTSNYSVVGTGTNGCISSAVVSTVTVNSIPTVAAASNASLICNGQTASLTASGASTYSWNTSATTSVVAVSPSVTTSYTVTGTTNGCSNSTTITQSVSACTGLVNNVASSIGLIVYPNPNTGLFTIELNNGSVKTIEVMDITGRIVLANTTSNSKVDFNISTLANGVYYVKVQSNNSVEVIKIVKQ